MQLNELRLHQKEGRRWIGLPREYVAASERKFAPIVEFPDRKTSDRFQAEMLAALDLLVQKAGAKPEEDWL